VKQSGGHIWFYSEPGKGTTFKLCFPSLRESHRPEAPRDAERESAPRGSETILLVEDDAQLRTMARAILIRQGYQVLDAADGAEALILSARFSGEIALLLTDVVMPRMSGRDLATELEHTRPNMRVLFMSGYTDNAIVRNGVLETGLFFLQKPITPNILARKVRHVLDWRNGGV
jgi:DNA-binding response OmpR family regulator